MEVVSIITTKKVDRVFSKEECLLRRTIGEIKEVNGIETYEIITDFCNYVDISTPILESKEIQDELGNPTGEYKLVPVLDGEGNETFDVTTNLVSLGVKQRHLEPMGEVGLDLFFEQIKPALTLDTSWANFKVTMRRIALLERTKADEPWGVEAGDWEVLIYE